MQYVLILAGLVLLALILFFVFKKKPKLEKSLIEQKEITPIAPRPELVVAPKISWTDRLSLGLEKSRTEVWGKIGNLFSGGTPSLDEIEEILYTADIPTGLVQELLSKLDKHGKGKSADDIQQLVYGFMKDKMEPIQHNIHKDVFAFDSAVKNLRHSLKIQALKVFGCIHSLFKVA